MLGIKLYSAQTTSTSAPVAVKASGTITSIAGSAFVDGETFTIDDGLNKVVFELDSDSSVTETDILRKVAFTSGDNSTTTAATIATAINASILQLTAVGSSATVTMTHKLVGPKYNTGAIADAVANGTFAVTALTNGAIGGFSLYGQTPGTEYYWDHRNVGAIEIQSTAGSGTMTLVARVSGYSPHTQSWQPLGTNTTEASRGLINIDEIDEDPSDVLRSSTIIYGLSQFSRIDVQLTIGGTNTAVDVWLVPVGV